MQRTSEPRTNHYLRPNHDSTVPQCCCVVSLVPVEVKDAAKDTRYFRQLGIGSATYWRWVDGKPTRYEDLYFNTPEQFWLWLTARHTNGRSLWLFAHGMGEALTLLDFWNLLDTGFYSLEESNRKVPKGTTGVVAQRNAADYLLCTRDPPTIVLARHRRHFLQALDVRNYFPETLAKLGDLVGLERLPFPKRTAPPHHWEEYAKRDTDIVKKVLCRLFAWWEAGHMGVFRYTAAALSYAHYRHAHMKQQILIDDCEPARLLGREALIAGECRLFYCGRVADELEYAAKINSKNKHAKIRLRCGPVYIVDVNSLYPAVMRLNTYPRKLVAYKPAGELADLAEWSKTLCLVARVRINTPDRSYPCMVEKHRWWAVGDFWTTLAGPELLDAYKAGLVRQIGAIAAYLPGRLFTSFVDALYPQKVAARHAGRHAEDHFIKMLLNSLPGKFSQQMGGWDWANMPGPGPMWGVFPRAVDGNADPKLYRLISGYVQVEQDKADGLDTLPAIAAYVNSYARLFMRAVRADLPAGSILYQDTDSLHLTQEGYEALRWKDKLDDERLGYFHLERIAQTAEYRGPKDYTIDGEHVISGMKDNLVKITSSHYFQEERVSLDTILSEKPGGVVQVETVKKSYGKSHPRGVLWADGSVTPAVVTASRIRLTPS